MDSTGRSLSTIRQVIKVLRGIALYMPAYNAMGSKLADLTYVDNQHGAAIDTLQTSQTTQDVKLASNLAALIAHTAALNEYAGTLAALGAADVAINSRITALPPAYVSPIKNYEGTTNAQGTYSVTFSPALAAIPYIQVELISANPRDVAIITRSAGSFSVTVQRRVDVVGLLPTYIVVAGAIVSVQITPK